MLLTYSSFTSKKKERTLKRIKKTFKENSQVDKCVNDTVVKAISVYSNLDSSKELSKSRKERKASKEEEIPGRTV